MTATCIFFLGAGIGFVAGMFFVSLMYMARKSDDAEQSIADKRTKP